MTTGDLPPNSSVTGVKCLAMVAAGEMMGAMVPFEDCGSVNMDRNEHAVQISDNYYPTSSPS
jgi:hypothetical protein